MHHKTTVIQTDTELLAAALSQRRVTVWIVRPGAEMLIDYGGPVTKYTPAAVTINGVEYERELHEFRT